MIIRKIIFALCVIGTLVFFSMDSRKKEDIIANGTLMYFEMAQRDPRSLMQGDYMRLNYRLTAETEGTNNHEIPADGYAVVSLDKNKVAWLVRVQDKREGLNDSEHVVHYYTERSRPRLGPSSYFFEEGKADCFSTARYAGMRVNKEGNLVLVGLYDWDFCHLVERDSASYAQWIAHHPVNPNPPARRRRGWFGGWFD